MKKVLSVLLAIVMVVSLVPMTAFATGNPTFTVTRVSSDSLSPGDEFTVDVNISGNTEGFTNLVVYMEYDSNAFTFVKAENGSNGTNYFAQVTNNNGNGFSHILAGTGDPFSVNGCVATVTFSVNNAATAGAYTIGAKIGELSYGEDETEIQDSYSDPAATISVTIAGSTAASFKDGDATYTYDQIAADASLLTPSLLTAPGENYHFAGWFSGLTEGNGISIENGRYILTLSTTGDVEHSGVTECRPKYGDTAAEGTTYNALWVIDTTPLAYVLLVKPSSIVTVALAGSTTESTQNTANYNALLRAASTLGSNNNTASSIPNRVKLLYDMTLSTTLMEPAKGVYLDLNGNTLTYSGVVLQLKGTTNRIDSSYGEGGLSGNSGSGLISFTINQALPGVDPSTITNTNAYLSLYDTHIATALNYITVSAWATVTEISRCRFTGSTSDNSVSVTQHNQYPEQPGRISAIRNCYFENNYSTGTNSAYYLFAGSADGSIGLIENTQIVTNRSRVARDLGSLTFGDGNTITSNYYWTSDEGAEFRSLFKNVGSLSFGANNTLTAANAEYLFSCGDRDNVSVTFTSPTGTYQINAAGTILDNQGGKISFIAPEGYSLSETAGLLSFTERTNTYTVTYHYGINNTLSSQQEAESGAAFEPPAVETPVVDGLTTYTFEGWSTTYQAPSEDISGVTLFNTASGIVSEDIDLYAVYSTVTEMPVFSVKFTTNGVETTGGYNTIESINNAYVSGTTKIEITMNKDYTVSSSSPSEKFNLNSSYYPADYVLDLNGHTLTLSYTGTLFDNVQGKTIIIKSSAENGKIIKTVANNTLINFTTRNTTATCRVEFSGITIQANAGGTTTYQNCLFSTGSSGGSTAKPNITIDLINVTVTSTTLNSVVNVASNTYGSLKVNITESTLSYKTALCAGSAHKETMKVKIDSASKLKNAGGTDPLGTATFASYVSCSDTGNYQWTAVGGGWYQYQLVNMTVDGSDYHLDTTGDQEISGSVVVIPDPSILAGLDSLTVTKSGGLDSNSVTFNAAALDNIAAADGPVMLTVGDFTGKSAYADAGISLTLVDGSNSAIDFSTNSGSAEVTMMYFGTAGKDYEVFYVNGGSRTPVSATVTDSLGMGMYTATFTTTHFSDYEMVEQFSFTDASMTGLSTTSLTGVTGGKVSKGDTVTATYTYSGPSSINSITASVGGSVVATATESSGTWTLTIPAASVTGNITVTATMNDPVFTFFYKPEGTTTDSDNDGFIEVDPNGTVTFGVYVMASEAGKTLQAFDVYPMWGDQLTNAIVTAAEDFTITTDAMSAAQPHFQSVATSLNQEVGITKEAALKIATISFTLSENAVYDTQYPVYFRDTGATTNIGIGATPNSMPVIYDSTGTETDSVGAETLKQVEVTFNINTPEGTAPADDNVAMSAQNVDYNKATALNANTFKVVGYTFKGWATSAVAVDAEITYADQGEVTLKADTHLYAVWQPATVEYTVKHMQQNTARDGYTEYESETLTGFTGETTAAVAKSYTGFTAQPITQQTIAADGSTVVEIRYNRIAYTVTFDPNAEGATVSPTTKQVYYGCAYGVLPEPSNGTYRFLGWYTDATNGDLIQDTSVFNLAGDQTLYAHWTEQLTVIFEGNKPETATANVEGATEAVTGYNGDTVTLTSNGFSLTGWTFAGWNTEADGSGTNYEDGASYTFGTTGATLYAQWTANAYTVTFNKNDDAATGTMSDQSFTYDVEQALTANAFEKEHYHFLGWATTSNGGKVYDDQASVKNLTDELNGTVTLYALWEIDSHTITVDAGEHGTRNDTDDPTANYGSSYTLPAVDTYVSGIDNGYAFSGWLVNGETKAAGDEITITGDTIITAQYTPITYTITFELGGGTIDTTAYPNVTLNEGVYTMSYNIEDTKTLPAATYGLNTFGGWTLATTTYGWNAGNYKAESTAVTNRWGDVTLVAVWTTPSFTSVVENYKYAPNGYVMLRIDATELDTAKVYKFGDQVMYYTTDDNYKINGEDTGTFFWLIPSETYTSGADLTPAGVAQITIDNGNRADVTRDGHVNTDEVINIADANAVYQMVVNGGNYYSNIETLPLVNRLQADVNTGTDFKDEAAHGLNAEHRGSLADVNAIVNAINTAAQSGN